jgi:hypothetical protein
LVGVGLCSACTSRAPEPSETRVEPGAPAAPGLSHSSARSTVERQRAIEKFSRTLAPHLSRSGEGLASHLTHAGSRRIPLDGRFRSVHVAVRGPDGETKTHCVTSKAELDALLKRGRP